MEVLSKRCKRTSADAFKLVQPEEIGMYLIFRIILSPTSIRKQNIRQSTVYGYYKTLQMVYCLDARRRLEKPTNDMIHAVRSPASKNFVAVIRFHSSSVQSTITNECLNMYADQKLVYQN